ncbi:hypothetical protein CEY12_06130 [Chryseobacterium sp. T16E-39]|uniref:hypothetical protein n=1 Tax=Chryseobacterium sp. T16E-39 TaxID=2015076 RepID=UPI000B5B2BFA|nr:hypothetical protein [Chryseobacterium sp. T16E-39]ASK29706.1 hypothetical protein CEY12_06130 [Chryseobacterium sp. T16E-39]
MLTGKAKEDFEKWYIPLIRKREDIQDRYWDENLLSMIYRSGDIVLNAFFLEWFDSVGIYIQNWCSSAGIDRPEFDSEVFYKKKQHTYNDFFKTRQESLKWAIEKANEIYNQQL